MSPYLDPETRYLINFIPPPWLPTPGALNYCFTLLAKAYLEQKGTSYQSYNDIIGALESAKEELYRRRVAQYEDAKIESNGDVW